jgi:hypothetical protein
VGLTYSTYLGGSLDDVGLGVARRPWEAYVTGELFSGLEHRSALLRLVSAFARRQFCEQSRCLPREDRQPYHHKCHVPLTYFTYREGGDDIGRHCRRSVQGAHAGTTNSGSDFIFDPLQDQLSFGGSTDAFVAQILTTSSGKAPGDYVSFLGGSGRDRGVGIAIDVNNTAYVAGDSIVELSKPAAPPAPAPFNRPRTQDAFLVRIGKSAASLNRPYPPTASPNPASLGNPSPSTFTFVNQGPDPAAHVVFSGSFPLQ